MKKQYKKPEATIFTVKDRSIISTSAVNYSGSNLNKGSMTAESIDLLMDDFWDEEW